MNSIIVACVYMCIENLCVLSISLSIFDGIHKFNYLFILKQGLTVWHQL